MEPSILPEQSSKVAEVVRQDLKCGKCLQAVQGLE